MIRRFKKTKRYQAPGAGVMPMALESNFCATVRFKVMMDVDPLENMNDAETNADIAAEYFEDIIS